MANKISEAYRVSMTIVPQTIDNTNLTGQYVPMAGIRRLIAVMSCGAAAVTKTNKLELWQAKTAAGGSAKIITVATATGTANTKAKKVTIDVENTTNDDTLVVNSTTYTKVASGASGNEYVNAAGLKALLDARDGLTAADATHVVTVTADDPGFVTAAVGSVDEGTTTIVTLESVIVVEIYDGQVDFANDFIFVAPKITTTATGVFSCVFLAERKVLPVSQSNLAASYPA